MTDYDELFNNLLLTAKNEPLNFEEAQAAKREIMAEMMKMPEITNFTHASFEPMIELVEILLNHATKTSAPTVVGALQMLELQIRTAASATWFRKQLELRLVERIMSHPLQTQAEMRKIFEGSRKKND